MNDNIREPRDFSPEIIQEDEEVIEILSPSSPVFEKSGKRIKWQEENIETIKFFKITDPSIAPGLT